MSLVLDLNATHHVVAASSHLYIDKTQEIVIDRTLAHHDIVYLVEGEWKFIEEIDGQEVEYVLKPDDILILSAGSHKFKKMPCAPGTRTYCIHISKEGHDLLDNCTNGLVMEPHFSCSGNPRVMNYFKAACDAFWEDEPYSQARTDAFITLLLCEIAKIGEGKPISPEVAKVIKLISTNVSKPFDKEELVKASGLSYKRLLNLFKEETGQTLLTYQTNKKLELIASHLGSDPDVRLKELASSYNFYDEFYLSKLFKKKYGLSPLEYKNKYKYKRSKYDTIC